MYKFVCIFALWIGWFGHQLIRGKSTAPSMLLMVDKIYSVDKMSKKKPLAQLLCEFYKVHGNKYSYKDVNDGNYKNNKSKIPVICREHGVFHIIVDNHNRGQGCPECAKIQRKISNTGNYRSRRGKVYGVGINDFPCNIKANNKHIPAYHVWAQMLKRSCDKTYKKLHPTYKDCCICEDWKSFSIFKQWFDANYVKGYSLDKDILVKGNKIYSPETCCFVPQEINTLLCKSDKARGRMPIGVHERKMVKSQKYIAYLNNSAKKHFYLGTFDTPERAFMAYKVAKEAHVREMASQYYNEGKIIEKVYNALMNYKIEITD